MKRSHSVGRKQSGVALITAILLVALATLLAAKLSWDNTVSVRRTEMTLMQEQARHFALGGEAGAIDVIRQDDDPLVDVENDFELINEFPPTAVDIDGEPMGAMDITFVDVMGKLNVNNLMVDDQGQSTDSRSGRAS